MSLGREQQVIMTALVSNVLITVTESYQCVLNTFSIYLHVAGYSVLGWNHPGFAGSSVSEKHIAKAE